MKTKLLLLQLLITITVFTQNTYVPDNNFEQALIDLGYDTPPLDDYVPTANINTVTDLDISNKSISNITGIHGFTALTTLICADNQIDDLSLTQNVALIDLDCSGNELHSLGTYYNTLLSSLDCSDNQLGEYFDLTQNTALTNLNCSNNQLNDLNLTQNTALVSINCSHNSLRFLDLSQNTALSSFICNDNPLIITLDIRNGNNTNISNTDFNATNNPFLTCISVDDVAYSTTNWTNIDPQTSFSTNCPTYTYVPDTNFEQALIDLGYDDVLDDYVLTANINTVTELSIFGKNILDLTGIEGFTALTDLDCHSNFFGTTDFSNNTSLVNLDLFQTYQTYLDISMLSNLEYLNVGMNHLTELNTSQNTALEMLYCYYNDDLLYIDVSNNPALTKLVFFGNPQVSDLDVTNNTNLNYLDCRGNHIFELDLSNNINLTMLNCAGNNLTELDLSNNTKLERITCANNQLTEIDFRNENNDLITFFYASLNPNLNCIFVDNKYYCNENWVGTDFEFDPQTHFVETQTECDAVSDIDDLQQQISIIIFPNPTQEYFIIDTSSQYERVNLYNAIGQLVAQFDKQNKYNIKNLPVGVYYIKLNTSLTILTKKLIKE